jgi:hypothetical protein
VATVHRHFYPEGLRGHDTYWGDVSKRLRPLTQDRFLEAWVIEEPPLPLDGWWPGEQTPDGRRFLWGAAGAKLQLPPIAPGSKLGVALRPAPGSEALIVALAGRTIATIDGRAAERRMWVDIDSTHPSWPTRMTFHRARGYPPGGSDARPLAVQLFEMRVLSPTRGWSGPIATSWQRDALHIESEGFFDAERFPGAGEGAWLEPRAVLRVPAGRGLLRLRVWAPRPTPPETVIRIAGQPVAGPLEIGSTPAVIEFEIPAGGSFDERLEIELESAPYRPADDGLADPRELGVVLSSLEYKPGSSGS